MPRVRRNTAAIFSAADKRGLKRRRLEVAAVLPATQSQHSATLSEGSRLRRVPFDPRQSSDADGGRAPSFPSV